jgi:hypothetical protein
MATYLQTIPNENKRITHTKNLSPVFTMAFGSELKFTRLDSVNDAGFNNNKYNSLWSMFNLNSEKTYDSYNVQYSEGGMIGTLWESILEAYNTDGMVMFEVDDQNFRKYLISSRKIIKTNLTY